jgi:hypothetical protein
MPTPKQMEKLANAAAVGRNRPAAPAVGPCDDLPDEYWQAVLNDVSADERPAGSQIQKRRLCEIERHVLRVSCSRCGRTVEIQKADAVRMAGADALWKNVGQRLLDDTCQQRTGRHEDDGCWPSFE